MNTATCLPSNGLLTGQKSASTRCLHKALHGAKWLRLPLLLLLVTASNLLRGQADIDEGYYYIRNTNSSGYYLCPSWTYNYNSDMATPFLTTYTTGMDRNSVWRITKVMDGGEAYYRLLHVATGKYLTVNEEVSNSGGTPTARLRLHLEASDSPGEATLFFAAKHTNGYFAFRPKSSEYYDATSGYCWFDIAEGNQSSYYSGSSKGTLGFWRDESASIGDVAKWALEAAEETLSTPVISYNAVSQTYSISYPLADGGVSIHYTTDGTDPDAGSATYSTSIPAVDGQTLKAIATKGSLSSDIAEVTYSPVSPVMLRNGGDNTTSYYLCPPMDPESTTDLYVTTSNVPTQKLVWLIEYAGTDGFYHYYHFRNQATGQYLYCSGNNNSSNTFVMKNLGADGTEANRFKFRFVSSADGAVLVVSGNFTMNVTNAYMFKSNGNNKPSNYLGCYADNANGYGRWTIVSDDPKTASQLPSTMATTASEAHYFKIQNVNDNNYYLNPQVLPERVAKLWTAANSANNDWYMEMADDDDAWATYYYIRNANTGEYLYFMGNVSTDNTFYTSYGISSDADREYKFIIVRTAGTTAKDNESYNIIPKKLRNTPNQANIAMQRNITSNLRTGNSRDSESSRWNFVPSGFVIAPPIITYNANDNTISLGCTTPGVTCYYTTDGTEPTTGSTPYSGPFALPDDATVIKAIAIKGGNTSETATYAIIVRASTGTTKRMHYIQNMAANNNFYLIPGHTDKGITYVNTTSLPRASMQWYFKDAGVTNGVQYYYILNDYNGAYGSETTGYLYCNGNTANMKESLDAEDADNYKFAIFPYLTGGNVEGYYIEAKVKVDANAGTIARTLYKNDANNKTTSVSTNGNIANLQGRWKFETAKPTLPAPCTISTTEHTTYYNIQNVAQTAYVALPAASNVMMTADAGNDQVWYFLEADHDEWLTYYYIVHAATGNYLYFKGTSTSDQYGMTVMPIAEETPETADRYQFAIAGTITEGQYYIVPRTYRYVFNHQYHVVYKESNQLKLKTNGAREGTNTKWIFNEHPFKCATPTFSYTPSSRQMTISCSTPGVSIRYTTDGSNLTVSTGTVYTGTVTLGESVSMVRAIAYRNTDGSDLSDVGVFTFNEISSTSQITSMSGYYVLASGFSADGSVGTEANPFTGTIDGDFHAFSLNAPLIAYAKDATIKNVVVSKATISGGDNVGAIANIATGNTRIYNCGILDGTVSGTGNVGGLVGKLDGYARVINCYSYADITGGTTVGGIVGYNNYATTQTDLRTMVMNCMMYGDITGSTTVYPVYGGVKITNKGSNAGVNNYNFYRDEASITVNDLDHYNCSWPVEEEFLTRFDYVRSALNANRELCAWWITGNVGDTALVAKWVYAPEEATYPILKSWGRYPSMINRDIDGKSLYSREGANAYEGKAFGMLDVTVKSGKEHADDSIQRIITDMDTLHHDFGYYKIQLPYYNDVFGDPTSSNHTTRYGGNYTDSVVVGWDVVSVTGGTKGKFSDDRDTGYNFADRLCTDKDIYKVSGRVFAQGGYYYVPDGVTAVTIKAHWAKAYYCANYEYYLDRVDFSPSSTTTYAFAPAGTVAKTFHEQPVYAGLIKAQQAISSGGVYDNAIVLVGNVQHRNGFTNNFSINSNKSGFTVMSVDLDFDDEPDYALPLQMGQSTSKPAFSPVRFDFVQAPDLGMVLKRDGDKNRLAVSCIFMLGHFEITETSALHFNEIYFGNNKDEKNSNAQRVLSPIIFNGGQTIEFVASESKPGDDQLRTLYIIAGGNAHMRSLYQGNHNLETYKIKHAPMSVMGGEFDECYLSGNLRSMAASAVYADSPRLYTNGGRFKIIAGAGQESVNGSVYFRIDHSIIDEFYGGATSAGGEITGNIDVQIDHSLVGYYCGGPMVGNMASGKTITTRATGSTFGQFFGAGNGGTSFTLLASRSTDLGAGSIRNNNDGSWGLSANYTPMRWTSNSYEAKFHFEIWQVPSGTGAACASRRYVYGAQFAATKTGSVTSTLDSCTFLGDFYGAGNLGAVEGDVTSTLTDCTVHGSAFGAGYSAAIPSFKCYLLPPDSYPWQDPNTSICHDYKVGQTVSYTWTNEGVNGDTITRDGVKYVHTDYSLENLGSVTGDVSLTVNGATHVMQNVFGGGNESAVIGNTSVLLEGNAEVSGNVYGGGNVGTVSSDSQVTIRE